MAVVSMKSLLESGVHFGHRTNKWHPAMKPYIFTERNNIHIIDLQQTVKALEEAYALVRDKVAEGGTILFVGTKRQAQETIETEAQRCGMPYVIYRWLGGTLTNWSTIRKRINELERLERMRESGEFEQFTKKEALNFNRKIDRLDMLLGGVRNMIGIPDLLFVVDVRREETAIHEANLLKIPVIAMVDTNCDPRNVDYIIPSNDDAIRAIKLLVSTIANAVIEGKAMRKEEEELEDSQRLMGLDLEESELSDEELLGESTLAKISASQPTIVAEEETIVEEAEAEIADQVEAVEIAEELIAEEIDTVAAEEEAVVEEAEVVEIAEDIITEEIETIAAEEEAVVEAVEAVEEAKEEIAEEMLEGEKPLDEIVDEIEMVEAAEEVIAEEVEVVEVEKEVVADQISEVIEAEETIEADVEAIEEEKEIIVDQIDQAVEAEKLIEGEVEAVEAAEGEILQEDSESTAEEDA
jgi:small subunit ribosomal protein S2